MTTELNQDFSLVQNLSTTLGQMPNYKQSISDSITKEILKSAINEHNHIQNIWLQWELNKINTNFNMAMLRVVFIDITTQ